MCFSFPWRLISGRPPRGHPTGHSACLIGFYKIKILKRPLPRRLADAADGGRVAPVAKYWIFKNAGGRRPSEGGRTHGAIVFSGSHSCASRGGVHSAGLKLTMLGWSPTLVADLRACRRTLWPHPDLCRAPRRPSSRSLTSKSSATAVAPRRRDDAWVPSSGSGPGRSHRHAKEFGSARRVKAQPLRMASLYELQPSRRAFISPPSQARRRPSPVCGGRSSSWRRRLPPGRPWKTGPLRARQGDNGGGSRQDPPAAHAATPARRLSHDAGAAATTPEALKGLPAVRRLQGAALLHQWRSGRGFTGPPCRGVGQPLPRFLGAAERSATSSWRSAGPFIAGQNMRRMTPWVAPSRPPRAHASTNPDPASRNRGPVKSDSRAASRSPPISSRRRRKAANRGSPTVAP